MFERTAFAVKKNTFCNITNAFAVTLINFIGYFLNKSIIIFNLTPNFWILVYIQYHLKYHGFHKNIKELNCFQHW